MSKTLKISIIRPGKQPYNTEGTSLVIPGVDGYLGIMNDRQPLLSIMNAGVVSISNPNGKKTYFAISGGFAEVVDNSVTLLCDSVVTTNDIQEQNDEVAENESNKKTLKKLYTKDFSKLSEAEKREYLIGLLNAKISKELE